MSDSASGLDLFQPNPSKAHEIDALVRGRFLDSLSWLDEPGLTADRAPIGWTARPVDFGFYFDLAAAKHHGAGPEAAPWRAAEAEALGASLESEGRDAQTPRITTLGPAHYTPLEIDCLKRWFDLEPDNAMALVPLDEASLRREEAAVRKALAALERHAPDFHGELTAITTELIFARTGPEARMRFGGASSFSLWGGMALSPHSEWWEYVPRLVHEYSHNLLFGLAADGPLVTNEPEARYYSPLRGTERPMDGIFHAFYVTGREVLLRRRLDEASSGETDGESAKLAEYCRRTLPEIVEAHEDCFTVVSEHAALTDLGRRVVADTRSAMNRAGLET